MISLEDELVTYLTSLAYPINVSIRSAYSKLSPTYPLITVNEVDNRTLKALLGEEYLSSLMVQVDIYSKDMAINNVPTAGKTVTENLATIVDSGLQSYYGMSRTSYVKVPDVGDSTIFRLTMRFSSVLDVKNELTYR